MAIFDRLLVAPSDDELVAALVGAAEVTGADVLEQLLGSRRSARRVSAKVARQPEGRRQWEEIERYVSLAWWTDHQGRRHVRLCAGNSHGEEGQRHFSQGPDHQRPPLWHVYPEGMFQRTKDGEKEWLASCECGATGPPLALAWMGPHCGPCHDRREEGLPLAPPLPTTIDFGPSPVRALALTPDGSALAVARPGEVVRSLDRKTGLGRDLMKGTGDREERALAFSPDGRELAVGDSRSGGARVCSVTGEGAEVLRSWGRPGEVASVAFSPSGRMLVALRDGGGLEAWLRDSDGSWQSAYYEPSVTASAFAPDGRTLALGDPNGRVRLIDAGTRSERRSFRTDLAEEEEFLFMAFVPAGTALVLLTGTTGPDPPRRPQLRIYDLDREEERSFASVPMPSAVALSPDGRYLAWVVHDLQHSPASVTFWDVSANEEHCRLEWDTQDMVYDLAFSADGEVLATGLGSGTVKLWPWRALVAGPA